MESLNTLVRRFNERHDPKNTSHKDLQVRLNDLCGQVRALEILRLNRDPLASLDAHDLTVGRAAARLRQLGEVAAKAIEVKEQETAASFTAAFREHGKLQPGPYGREIRARLYDMKPTDKVRTIQALIEAKDGASLSALFDAPPMLTGLSAEDIGKFREQFYLTACPDIVKSRDIFRDLTEHVQTAVKISLIAATEYSDPRKLRELEEREAALIKAGGELKGA